jgi:hypothetical protein
MADANSASADAVAPSPAATPTAKRRGPPQKKPKQAASDEVRPKIRVPIGTMSSPFRNVFTQVSLRGLRQLSNEIGLSSALQSDAEKAQLEALHELSIAYNVYVKVQHESAKAFGLISPVSFRAYQPVHTVCAAAIESLTSYKHDSGILICMDKSSTLEQIETWRAALWGKAYGNVAMPTDPSDFGRLTNIAKYQSFLNRNFSREAFRVPADVADFSIIHCGCVKIGRLRQVVGPTVLTQLSELLTRVLDLRRYESIGIAYRYVPVSEDDFDSIHFTSGVCSGRAWDYQDALLQLRSAVSPTGTKHQIC